MDFHFSGYPTLSRTRSKELPAVSLPIYSHHSDSVGCIRGIEELGKCQMAKLSVFVIYATSLVCALSLCEPARTQQVSCTPVELPVNVILPDGRLVRGLQRDHLVALAKKDRLKIESITQDAGPRRILFVLDTGRDLPSEART